MVDDGGPEVVLAAGARNLVVGKKGEAAAELAVAAGLRVGAWGEEGWGGGEVSWIAIWGRRVGWTGDNGEGAGGVGRMRLGVG